MILFFLLKSDQALEICLKLGLNDGDPKQGGMQGSHMTTLQLRLYWF